MKNIKNKLIIIGLICTVVSGCAQKADYVIKPSGTHETESITIVTPTTTESSIVETTKQEESAVKRMELFKALITAETLAVRIEQVHTVGETLDGVVLTYNRNNTMREFYSTSLQDENTIEHIVQQDDAEYVLDDINKVKYIAELGTFTQVQTDAIEQLFTTNIAYDSTGTEMINDMELVYDSYTDTEGNVWRYYYDAADVVIVIRKIGTDGVQVNYFWKILNSVEQDTLDLTTYVEEKYIK